MSLSSLSSARLIVAAIACTATLTMLWGASRVGLFTKIEFKVKKLPKGSRYLVKGHRGEYKDAKQHIKSLPSSTEKSVVIYWDDPRIMEKRCRFSVGIPCESYNDAARTELTDKTDQANNNEGWTECIAENDMEVLYCEFPYTGTVSSIVAAIRVYPLWVEEAKRLGKGHGPIIKITPTKVGDKIEFYFLTMPPPTTSSFTTCMSKIA